MLPAVIDAAAVRLLFSTLAAWLHRRDADAITYLLEENRTPHGAKKRPRMANRRGEARAGPWSAQIDERYIFG